MYCRLEADATESEDDASEHGDPKSEMETSRAQCTSFCGMAAIVMVSGVDAELEDVIVVRVFVDVEQAPTRSDHVPLRMSQVVLQTMANLSLFLVHLQRDTS